MERRELQLFVSISPCPFGREKKKEEMKTFTSKNLLNPILDNLLSFSTKWCWEKSPSHCHIGQEHICCKVTIVIAFHFYPICPKKLSFSRSYLFHMSRWMNRLVQPQERGHSICRASHPSKNSEPPHLRSYWGHFGMRNPQSKQTVMWNISWVHTRVVPIL